MSGASLCRGTNSDWDTHHPDQPGNERLTKDPNTQTKDEIMEKRQKPPNRTTPPSMHDLPHSKGERLAKLIGRRALTHCNLNGLAVSALLDTGAQVSMIDRNWKGKYLPDTPVRPLTDIIGDEDELRVYAVNGDALPCDDWVALTVNLMGNVDPNLSITVPFLVSSLALERPLLGFNVLEEMIQEQPEKLISLAASTVLIK